MSFFEYVFYFEVFTKSRKAFACFKALLWDVEVFSQKEAYDILRWLPGRNLPVEWVEEGVVHFESDNEWERVSHLIDFERIWLIMTVH